MVKRQVTGGGYGLMTWVYQRITAILMLIGIMLLCGFVIKITTDVDASIISWQNAFNSIFVKIIAQIFVGSLLIHAWVGVRDIWMDYIQIIWVKMTLHTLTALWLIGGLFYSIKILWF